jgi:hypothetical protein
MLDREALLKAIEGIPKPTIEVRVLYLKDDNESYNLAAQIWLTLGAEDGPDWPMRHLAMADGGPASTAMWAGGSPEGVTVTENVPNLEVSVVGRALVEGLRASLTRVSFAVQGMGQTGTIRIIVAQKPI